MPSQYKGISKSAKGLLASGESKFVDYKEKVKGFHAEDLVAFANSNEGGIKGKPSVSIEMVGTAELDEDDLKRLLAEVAKALSHEGKDGS